MKKKNNSKPSHDLYTGTGVGGGVNGREGRDVGGRGRRPTTTTPRETHTPCFNFFFSCYLAFFWKIFMLAFKYYYLLQLIFFFDTHERFHYRHYFVQLFFFFLTMEGSSYLGQLFYTHTHTKSLFKSYFLLFSVIIYTFLRTSYSQNRGKDKGAMMIF